MKDHAECPFCGNGDGQFLTINPTRKIVKTERFAVFCEVCHARGPEGECEESAMALFEKREDERLRKQGFLSALEERDYRTRLALYGIDKKD